MRVPPLAVCSRRQQLFLGLKAAGFKALRKRGEGGGVKHTQATASGILAMAASLVAGCGAFGGCNNVKLHHRAASHL